MEPYKRYECFGCSYVDATHLSVHLMSATIHLVRHGTHEEYGRVLSGRSGTAPLNPTGRAQAERLGCWAQAASVAAIHASPRRRTIETAEIIAKCLALEPEAVDALDELDFGEWAGRCFDELEGDPLWRDWNSSRATACPPGGEAMAPAISRTVAHLDSIAEQRDGASVICVTHCDIIRGTLAHYLGLSLGNILRFEIDPGSISTVAIDPWGGRVTRINEVPA